MSGVVLGKHLLVELLLVNNMLEYRLVLMVKLKVMVGLGVKKQLGQLVHM